MLPEVIGTERLTLRPYRGSDLDDILEYASNPEWRRYIDGMPDPYTRGDAAAFLANLAGRDRAIDPMWAIELAEHVVGGIDFHFSNGHRIGDLGYSLSPRVWGRGLAVEAARAVITAAFTIYPQLVRIRATADARNARSISVMLKLCMQREALLRSNRLCRGELVDEVIYGLLRGEWRPR